MRIFVRVSYIDGSAVDVQTTTADTIAWERHFDKSWDGVRNDPRYTDFAYVAYSALKRTGKTDLEFDKWTESIDEIEVEPEREIVPLETAAPTG